MKANPFRSVCLSLLTLSLLGACASSDKAVEKSLIEHPEYIANAMDKNPAAFAKVMNKVFEAARNQAKIDKELEDQQKLEAQLKNPLKPDLSGDRLWLGNKNAEIILVEYSDFECPFCRRGYETVEQLLKKYKGKVGFLYKHNPLPFHPAAEPAALRYEAIKLQSPALAERFYHEVFTNQKNLKDGETFLDNTARKLKVDVVRMKKDMNSQVVIDLVKKDMEEAKQFGLSGTPAFVLNGVSITGARDISYFEQIIEKTKK